ncbi:MAG TPA: Gfo/Idh/MocA family oxidoreductase [Alphaproteobacteria bacterium]|nr:Gfo/Idh/MocA family oxidoreductase [Alphaproteobacteria bacterium]
MTPPVPMRVGLIGAGMISHYHLIAWSRLGSARVVAICDPDRTRAEARAREFGIAAVYASAEDMLAHEALDALDIASPRERHAEQVRLAAARGVPALCQKPLVPTYEEAERLIAEVDGKCRLMVHENWRFRPFYRRTRQWIDERRVGSLRSAAMTVRGSGLIAGADGRFPALERQPFMRDVPRLAVTESLIHHIDVVRWLVGPLQVLAARIGRTCPVIKGEDRATIMMSSADGVPVLVDGDMAAPGYPPRAVERLELTGTRATILFEDKRLSLIGKDATMEAFDLAACYQASFDDCIRHFIECLLLDAPFETDPRDNLQTLRLVEDTYRLAGPIASSDGHRRPGCA